MGRRLRPRYHYDLSSERSERGIETEVVAHSNVAVLISDVDISIAWGFDPDETLWSEHRQKFDLSDFLPEFGDDDNVSRMYVDIFHRGALVDRVLFVVADGGRHYVPIPRTTYPHKTSMRELPPDRSDAEHVVLGNVNAGK
ncbi:hypothetical protein [Mycolicibacterium sphagni]|uniref:Uncharacterized protein n=1 Tax=Mycolicibacterium sphagni TaxID=1786 RepID=A0ABX2JXH2_9MYCO|nr:hypothetical protein [Mycolicibacterium sphagni]NTY58725.1 hypothetical protein [Mycolicibacterium sphagni]